MQTDSIAHARSAGGRPSGGLDFSGLSCCSLFACIRFGFNGAARRMEGMFPVFQGSWCMAVGTDRVIVFQKFDRCPGNGRDAHGLMHSSPDQIDGVMLHHFSPDVLGTPLEVSSQAAGSALFCAVIENRPMASGQASACRVIPGASGPCLSPHDGRTRSASKPKDQVRASRCSAHFTPCAAWRTSKAARGKAPRYSSLNGRSRFLEKRPEIWPGLGLDLRKVERMRCRSGVFVLEIRTTPRTFRCVLKFFQLHMQVFDPRQAFPALKADQPD